MSITNDPEHFVGNSFDYLIIGGGTAGLAVATRLSENPNITVGVLEAGAAKLNDASILTPIKFPTLAGHEEYDWMMKTVGQPGTNNLIHAYPRGKVLGGSSAINYMVYVRGQATEYNDWARITGYQSWAWSGLQPFFLKHEAMTVPAQKEADTASNTTRVFKNEFHGTSGPIKTSFGNWSAPAEEAWHQTGRKMGLQWTAPEDAWSGSHLGGYSNLSTIDRSQGPGTRSYAVTGYLAPNSTRRNLSVLTEATVTKILLDRNAGIPTSTGATFRSNGQEFTVSARREVILAAGAVQTPQILELSGIGRGDVLRSVGLECIVENERVGEQFLDHPLTLVSYNMVDGEFSLDHMTQQAVVGEAMQRYGQGEGGPLANAVSGNAFLAIAQIATPEEMARINHAVHQ